MDASEFEHLDLVADLSDEDRAAVAAAATRHSFPPGREIIRRGEVTDGFFVMLDGEARVVRGDEFVDTLQPGSFFGEWASLVSGPGYALSRNATVITDSAVTVAVIPSERFTEFYSTIPAFRERVDAAMRDRNP